MVGRKTSSIRGGANLIFGSSESKILVNLAGGPKLEGGPDLGTARYCIPPRRGPFLQAPGT